MTESELQKLVTDLAVLYGWGWVHFRAARTKHGWRTAFEGTLGEGWPDLVLVHPGKRKTLYVELKRETESTTARQVEVLAWLVAAGLETRIWRPSDLDDPIEMGQIMQVLR